MNDKVLAAAVCAALLATAARAPAREAEELGTSVQEVKADSAAPKPTAPAPKKAQPADRCKQGFVWREARPGDHVCVTPQTREAVARQNRSAKERWVAGPYGPQTCVQGYVWREAFPGDKVCVTPQIRDRTREDNRMAPQRRVDG